RSQEVFHDSISFYGRNIKRVKKVQRGSPVTESTSLTTSSLSTLTTPTVVGGIARAQSSRGLSAEL
ncbi:unnamed protein product, partial [Heterotrigona itama]